MKKLLLIVALLSFVSCSKSKKPKEIMTNYKIVYMKGNVLLNDKPAKINAPLQELDVIEVPDNALAVVQFKNLAIVTLKANSKIFIKSLVAGGDRDEINLIQELGSVFSRTSGVAFSIYTPVAVVNTQNSSFETKVDESLSNTTIKIFDGGAHLSTVEKTPRNFNLKQGQKISATLSGSKIEQLADEEVKLLKNMNMISLNQITLTEEYLNPKPTFVGSVSKMSLLDIKVKYGKIFSIKTKGGAEYKGYYTQKGNVLTVIAEDGTYLIVNEFIEKIKPI